MVVPTMDSEILAGERAHHRRFRIAWRSVAGLLLAGAAAGLIVAAFHTSRRSGWVVTIGGLAIGLGLFLLARWGTRAGTNTLVTPGPWSYGQVYSGHQQREIWNAMGKVLLGLGMSFDRVAKTTALATRPGTFLYRRGVHLIDVQPSADHDGWFVITVFSQPDLPTTITDFGRGASINQALLAAVPGFRRPDDPELG